MAQDQVQAQTRLPLLAQQIEAAAVVVQRLTQDLQAVLLVVQVLSVSVTQTHLI
jgi:hypothetical protein